MPRKTIPLLNGEKYHIFNRGVDKRQIFLDKPDYIRFYNSLHVFNTIDPSRSYNVSKNKHRQVNQRLVQVHAYSLLPNHFHLILEQLCDNGISNFLKRTLGGYTSYFNDKYSRSGALFQGTYKRIHVDTDGYLRYLLTYVNENHFVHNLTRDIDICYSSSMHYQNKTTSKILPKTVDNYLFEEECLLAKSISKQREILKAEY